MKIVFFGNPFFAAKCLKNLFSLTQVDIQLVVTNPNKKMGRGLKLTPTDVNKTGSSLGLKIYEIQDLNNKTFINKLNAIKADVFVVIAYRILPYEIYSIPKYGTINLHASLLPRYIGASPIQYCLLNGDKKTGLTTFFINDKVDQGDIIYQKEISLDKHITYDQLLLKMINDSKETLETSLNLIIENKKIILTNINKKIAPKIKKNDFIITWDDTCVNIHNKIRALSYKGAYTKLNHKRIKFFNTFYIIEKHNLIFGSFKLKNNRLYIASKNGYLIAKSIQIEGKNIIDVVNFYNSIKDKTNIFDN